MTTSNSMTLEQAMTHCFKDEPHGKQRRKWFNNREAASIYSESLKDIWSEGLGQLYGAFCSKEVVPTGDHYWWEVSYK